MKRSISAEIIIPEEKSYAGVEPTGVKRTFGLWDAGHTVEYCHGYEQVDTLMCR
jgi:hypothetical protein